jgi:hypothetical protein
MDNDEYKPTWYPYENGTTIGEIGPEGGYVLRDEEYGDPDDDEDADARLTLEQGKADNPGFPLSATLYGWLFHVVRCDTQSEAEAAYSAMRSELEALRELLPYEEDGPKKIEKKAAILLEAITAFETKFPVSESVSERASES